MRRVFLPFSSLKILRGGIFLFLLLFPLLMFAQYEQSKAYATLDSNNMLVGDQITLHISVEHGDGARILRVEPDMPLLDTAHFEIIKDSKWLNKTRSSMRGQMRDIVFTVWDTGVYQIPPMRFEILNSSGEGEVVSTPPLMLKVDNPDKTEDMVAPIDIKPIMATKWTFSEDFLPVFYTILPYLLIALALGFLAWRYWQKRKAAQFKPIVQEIKQPPHIIAERLLAELKAKNLWQKGDLKGYYSELSHILRGYLEDGFNLPALESTTDELMGKLRFFHEPPFGKTGFDADLIVKIQKTLQTADLVKFAKVEPAEDLHDVLWSDVAEIVEKTKPKPPVLTENPSENG
jgi:BatD DUF11 like domain